MRNLLIGSEILLAVALIYGANAMVDLNGATGEAILTQINTPGATINTSATAVLGSGNVSTSSPQTQWDQLSQETLFGDLGGWIPT